MAGPGIPFTAIARALYSLLSGQSPELASQGVHQRVPPGTPKQYILVGKPTHSSNDTHTSYGHECTFKIDAYDQSDSEETVNGMMDAINRLLHCQKIAVSGYAFVSCVLDQGPDVMEERYQGDIKVQHASARYRIHVRTP